jgi:hypothetical protein
LGDKRAKSLPRTNTPKRKNPALRRDLFFHDLKVAKSNYCYVLLRVVRSFILPGSWLGSRVTDYTFPEDKKLF